MFIYIHVYLTTYFICSKHGKCVKVKVQFTLICLHVIIILTAIKSELKIVIDCGEGGRVYSRLQAHRQEFPEEVSSTRIYYGRGSGVFSAKSFKLAISRHFIQTFGKSCFPKLIFKNYI